MSEVLVNQVSSFFWRMGYAGLVLPDGWFGSPYHHPLGLLEVGDAADTFRVQFDRGEQLDFTGPDLAGAELNDVLTIWGFSGLTWRWRDFDSRGEYRSRQFDGGMVQLVGPYGRAAGDAPGTT